MSRNRAKDPNWATLGPKQATISLREWRLRLARLLAQHGPLKRPELAALLKCCHSTVSMYLAHCCWFERDRKFRYSLTPAGQDAVGVLPESVESQTHG